jgi:hypothetical protein
MVAQKPPSDESRPKVILFDGLSDLEQAAIAREYESRTGRPFRCQPCFETGRSDSLRFEAEADEPAREVVAVLEAESGPVPVCETCCQRIMDSAERL